MGMTEMSKAQRQAILSAYYAGRGYDYPVNARSYRTAHCLRQLGATAQGNHYTFRGLVLAGVDMDALHAMAIGEDDARSVAEGRKSLGWKQEDGGDRERQATREFVEAMNTPAEARTFGVSGWQHEDGTECPEYLAPADGRTWWCTPYQQHVHLPNTPAEARTGISDRTAAALDAVNRLRENAAAMDAGRDQDDAWDALSLIEDYIRGER